MADKAPCRWATETWDCSHPLVRHLVGSSGCWMKSLPWISPATCEGCPCHEPANLPEFPDSSTAPPDTQRTDPPTTCQWWCDEYGNWCCACSDTMPDFTPWKGTDPKGHFCPKCGKIITVRVHNQP